MRVNIVNLGADNLRVIIDGDTVNDFVLMPGVDEDFVSDDDGVIELQALGSVEPAEDVEGASAAT